MEEIKEQDISRKFGSRRIWIPLLIGLTVSGFLLYNNLTDVRFEEVAAGEGAYSWHDANGNGEVDYMDGSEFSVDETGNYIKHSYTEALGNINWTIQLVFWLFLAVLMMVVRDVGYMMRIRVLTDKQLSWRQSFRVIMMWEFASALTPGVVGGAAVAMFILNKEKVPLGRSTAIVLITAMLDNLFYILMIPIVLILVGSSQFFPMAEGKEIFGMHLNIYGIFWLAYGIVILLFGVLAFGVFFRPVWLKRLLVWIFSVRFFAAVATRGAAGWTRDCNHEQRVSRQAMGTLVEGFCRHVFVMDRPFSGSQLPDCRVCFHRASRSVDHLCPPVRDVDHHAGEPYPWWKRSG